ncbi:MAG: hypothetical protein V2A73_22090 [Pseudomonadota bacterium]
MEKENRSRISTGFAILDFSTFDSRQSRDQDVTDYFYLYEADFLYRLKTGIHAIRTGFGVVEGKGGYAEPNRATKAAFTYGYIELELKSGHNLGYLGRFVTGVGKKGLGFGAEGRIRMGPEDGTNLSFGISSLQEIGFLSEIRMQWNAIPSLPLGLAIGLTNQPNQGDLGVRFSADVGLRMIKWVHPTVRISYQGRTVQHSGLGAGVGLVFDW